MTLARLLLIDDSEDDVELLSLAMRQANAAFSFTYAFGGADGLARLEAEAGAVRLVLLDIKMPGMDGKAVLTAIRASPELRHLPVVMFSSSDAPAEVRECYRMGANAYIRKPDDLEGYRTLVGRLVDFWLGTARLP